MPAAANNSYIFQRLFGWIARKLQASKVARPAPDLSYFLPALFVKRSPFPVRPTVDAWDFAAVSAWRWVLAARLKSIAAQNVPKSRRGPRRKAAPPAGKAIPKKAARVLKRYKQEAVSPVATTLRRAVSQPPLRPGNVVALASVPKQARRQFPVFVSERQAA